MAEVIAIDNQSWANASFMHTPHANSSAKRCGSLQEQYAAFQSVQHLLRSEGAMLIRLPKEKDEIAPSGVIALRSLTQKSAGKALRPQCQHESEALISLTPSLAPIVRWLELMPGNWSESAMLSALHDTRSGHCVLGIHIKNIILFRSSFHALEAKLGSSQLSLVEEGARVFSSQAIDAIFAQHDIEYTPYKAVIQGEWK
jgi:hypothetical protein